MLGTKRTTTRLHFGKRPSDEAERNAAAEYLSSRGYTAVTTDDAGGYCVETNAPYETALRVKNAARGGNLTVS